ncbi:MAG: tetratricopeptide repeat protein [Acidimicrobiia bacterium]
MTAAPVKCPEPGCDGVIDDDGYCTVSGMKPSTIVSSGVASGANAASTPSVTPSSVGTTARSTITSPAATGMAMTAVRRRRGLGLGLVEVPSVELPDPESLVMTNPEVPEGKRFCACGEPVGRSKDGRIGRTEGFCPKDGQAYSFTPKLAPGDLVGGQYEVVGCLAHGGLGWVYLARDRNVDDKWIVLKGLLNSGDAEAVEVTIAELKFLAEVDHPNIVRVINFVNHDGAPYIVMEYVGGTSLRALLQARRDANGGAADPLPVTHAIAYMLEALPALGYLHGRGLLFCDFKADNVIQSGDSVKIIDLGGVYRMGDQESPVYGTPGYQAPEIATLGPSVASDLFTVARTLAVLCTNFRSYQSTYEYTLPTPADMPLYARYDSLYRFLLRATAPNPEERFQSADDMADELAGVLREIVALDGGAPSPAVSHWFTGELRSAANALDWRALPIPLVASDDAAAGFLAAVSANDTDELLALLDLAPETTLEVSLRIARELLDADRIEEAQAVLDALTPHVADAWRVAWHHGLCALALDQPAAAVAAFTLVYHALPGEPAPKVALGAACEAAGDLAAAEIWYDTVSRTDPNFTSAVFGLARCLLAMGERAGAVTAFDRVPRTSSASTDAQTAKVEAMLDCDPSQLSIDDVLAAAQVVDGLSLQGEARARLVVQVLVGALAVVPPSPNGTTPRVLGHELTDDGIRRGLESTYRALAKHAAVPRDRIEFVDEANRVRPRTLT